MKMTRSHESSLPNFNQQTLQTQAIPSVLMGEKLKGLAITILTCSCPLIVIAGLGLLLLSLPIWYIVQVSAKIFRPHWKGVTNPWDVFMSPEKALDKDVFNICAYHVIDGHVSTEAIRKIAQEKVFSLKNEKGQLVYSRLGETIGNFLGYSFWKAEENFDLNYHIRDYDYDGELALPAPPRSCSEQDVKEIIGRLTMLPWKENKPHWETLVVQNYSSGSSSKPQTLVLGRWHHLLMDGYSSAYFLLAIFNENFVIPKLAERSGRRSKVEETVGKMLAIMKIPSDLAGTLYEGFDASELFLAKRVFGREYNSCVSAPIRDVTLRKIGKKYGVAYMSVLVAIIAGALKRTFDHAEQPYPDTISAQSALPTAGHPLVVANHYDLRPVTFPLKSESSLHRLLAADENVRRSRKRWMLTPWIVLPFRFLPTILADIVYNRMIIGRSSTVLSTFIAQRAFQLGGYDVIDAGAIFTQFRTRMGGSILCYGAPNQLRVSIMINRDVIRSKEAVTKFADFLQEETEALLGNELLEIPANDTI